jgi:Na+/melibiose symporter-like transporter
MLSLLAVRAYPITREKHAEIRAELNKRKVTIEPSVEAA